MQWYVYCIYIYIWLWLYIYTSYTHHYLYLLLIGFTHQGILQLGGTTLWAAPRKLSIFILLAKSPSYSSYPPSKSEVFPVITGVNVPPTSEPWFPAVSPLHSPHFCTKYVQVLSESTVDTRPGKRLHSELENHHAINGKKLTNFRLGHGFNSELLT